MTFEDLFKNFETTTQKDLKLNFKKFLEGEHLSKKESGMIALSCAHTVDSAPLVSFLQAFLKENETSDEEIAEAADAASIMGIANNYYRFRHWIPKETYQKAAGFRMTVMMRPTSGKQTFEMMALAASIINGCEMCCKGHEKALVELGVSEDAIHDLARLASTVNGLGVAFRAACPLTEDLFE